MIHPGTCDVASQQLQRHPKPSKRDGIMTIVDVESKIRN
jgi:hypothetical protein